LIQFLLSGAALIALGLGVSAAQSWEDRSIARGSAATKARSAPVHRRA
jgi:hypothetical protein